jgi:GNAT superfamily N-acetyltransferase
MLGLGFDGPLDLGALHSIEREWRARREPARVELSVLAHPSCPVALSERGYHVHGSENVLGQSLAADLPFAEDEGSASEPTAERLRPEDESTWLDISVTSSLNLDGTGSPADDVIPRAELEEVLRDFAPSRGFQRYLARLDGTPVGAAAMRIDEGVAWLAGGDTLPEARGRGVHKALIRRRLADAKAAGADIAVVTTAPGSRSQQNVMRRGFTLLYTRIIFVKR